MPRRLPRSQRGRGVNGNYPNGNPRRRPRRRRVPAGRGRNFPGESFSSAAVSGIGISSALRSLFGSEFRAMLRYSGVALSVTGPAVGIAGAYVFSANGIYDPDITSTGGQVNGFDQMMSYFNHYTVIKSRIIVEASMVTAQTGTAAIMRTGDPTSITGVEQIIENGELVRVALLPVGVAGSCATLRANVNCARFQGLVNVQDDPNMRGGPTSNPVEQVYYVVMGWNTHNNTAVQVNFTCEIFYDVIFTEAKKGPLS